MGESEKERRERVRKREGESERVIFLARLLRKQDLVFSSASEEKEKESFYFVSFRWQRPNFFPAKKKKISRANEGSSQGHSFGFETQDSP